jgi:hypothetical protein
MRMWRVVARATLQRLVAAHSVKVVSVSSVEVVVATCASTYFSGKFACCYLVLAANVVTLR